MNLIARFYSKRRNGSCVRGLRKLAVGRAVGTLGGGSRVCRTPSDRASPPLLPSPPTAPPFLSCLLVPLGILSSIILMQSLASPQRKPEAYRGLPAPFQTPDPSLPLLCLSPGLFLSPPLRLDTMPVIFKSACALLFLLPAALAQAHGKGAQRTHGACVRPLMQRLPCSPLSAGSLRASGNGVQRLLSKDLPVPRDWLTAKT